MTRAAVARLARPATLAALVLALAPLLLSLSGCAAVGELAKSAFKKPTLRLEQVSVAAIDFDGATLAFDYQVENPNGFGLNVARLQYWLELEQRVVTRGEAPGGIRLPASGAAPVRFTTRLPFAEVPRLLELVRSRAPVHYKVGGLVGVDTPIGNVDLPLSHAGTVDLPRVPEFKVASVAVRMSSLTEVEVALAIDVANPNAFPLPGGELQYAVAVGGQVVASAEGGEVIAVPASGRGRMVIPVRLSLLGAGMAAATAVRGGGSEVRLSGQATIGALTTPFDVRARTGR
jgi:LEA14-like dessication related protein